MTPIHHWPYPMTTHAHSNFPINNLVARQQPTSVGVHQSVGECISKLIFAVCVRPLSFPTTSDDPSVRVHGNLLNDVFEGAVLTHDEDYHIEPANRYVGRGLAHM